MSIEPRKGQAKGKLSRDEFGKRFRENFYDPAFRAEDHAITRLENIAWDAYSGSRKAPITQKAGVGYADPDYDLSVEWVAARASIDRAQLAQQHSASPSRVLVINGSSRNDGTCPGEVSKSWRLSKLIGDELASAGCEMDLLDLSEPTSEYGLRIFPCKGCVSTAMPLCHWPCSCYPNHALNQIGDWMNDIYPRWVAAHGVIIVTPVYWWQSPGPLKLMIDRLVCADGGNPDPTSTHGKDAKKAKDIELEGWNYPKHLDGRAFGLVVHGDVAGIEESRRALSDWLTWMGLIDAGFKSGLARYVGYYEPYATSHATLDADLDFQKEAQNVARAVAETITSIRAGAPLAPGKSLESPRPK
jgi:multimeric flavodoxin WrbA